MPCWCRFMPLAVPSRRLWCYVLGPVVLFVWFSAVQKLSLIHSFDVIINSDHVLCCVSMSVNAGVDVVRVGFLPAETCFCRTFSLFKPKEPGSWYCTNMNSPEIIGMSYWLTQVDILSQWIRHCYVWCVCFMCISVCECWMLRMSL